VGTLRAIAQSLDARLLPVQDPSPDVISWGNLTNPPKCELLHRNHSVPQFPRDLPKGLVVLIDPQSWGEGIEGAVDRYVAMTRATQQLVVLTGP
jgi:hypothetical protein